MHTTALDAFDALLDHLHAAATACGAMAAWSFDGADSAHMLGDAFNTVDHTPTSAHARLAWAAAWEGADTAGRALWAALDAHPGLSPILRDTRPGLSLNLPWKRGPKLRVAVDPTGKVAALHLGAMAPMPALGADTGHTADVRAGLAQALDAPVGPGRSLLFVQDPLAQGDTPSIGVAMGPFVDRGAARHLLAGCTTKMAPGWVLCRLTDPTGQTQTPAGRWFPRNGKASASQDGTGAVSVKNGNGTAQEEGTPSGLRRYLTMLDNGNPFWFAATDDAHAHTMLEEARHPGKAQIVWTPIA